MHVHALPNKHWNSWMGRYVLERTSGIVTVSDFIRDNVVAITRDVPRVMTVHNGVPAFEPVTRPPYPKVRIGIVGQLIPLKKHDVLVDAVGLSSLEERAHLEVRIYGARTTEYEQEIVHRMESAGLTDCFRWMGFVGSQHESYGDLDVVVAPAVGEAFGLTVLEAGCWELPVIAARSGGFPETVLDGETGLLVEPDDPADLARALQRLMEPAERERLGRKAREHAVEHFSVSVMAQSFIAALASIGLKS